MSDAKTSAILRECNVAKILSCLHQRRSLTLNVGGQIPQEIMKHNSPRWLFYGRTWVTLLQNRKWLSNGLRSNYVKMSELIVIGSLHSIYDQYFSLPLN